MNRTEFEDYFVFMYVRDPVSCFYSSATQSDKDKKLSIASQNCTLVRSTLTKDLEGML